MRAFHSVPLTLLVAGLVLTAGAVPAQAVADPRAPRCESTTGTTQTVVAGEFTLLTVRCTSPSGAPLAATALNGSVTTLFGSLLYRAADAGLGYDKITVHLADLGPTGPASTVLVRVVE
jgi:hypothetical protein